MVAAVYLVQVNDSAIQTRSSTAAPFIEPPILVTQASAGGREWFAARDRIVPLGHKVLTLPILMYHYIRKPPSPRVDLVGYNLSVSPADFEAQMDWLERDSYHAVDFNDIRAYFAGVAPLPAKPVVITLDDGYSDLYTTAFPILQAHHFKAVAYIVSGFVNTRGYVTNQQVVQMDRSVIEIGAHTVTHDDLARAPLPWIMYEIVESKRWLEQLLGHPVVDFAYPSGKFNSTVIGALRVAGYSTAVTEEGSTLHSMDNRYTWGRVRVTGGEKLADFIRNLGPTMPSIVVTVIVVQARITGPAIAHPAD